MFERSGARYYSYAENALPSFLYRGLGNSPLEKWRYTAEGCKSSILLREEYSAKKGTTERLEGKYFERFTWAILTFVFGTLRRRF